MLTNSKLCLSQYLPMDNNSDPNNPATAIPGLGQPAGTPPADPSNVPWQPPVQTDVPQSSPVPGMDQTQVTPPTPNPWDNPNQGISNQNPAAPMSDPMGPLSQTPADPAPPAQSPWPSSTSTAGFGAQASQPPGVSDFAAPNPVSNPQPAVNPFLQPQTPGIGLPGGEQTSPEPGGSPATTMTPNFGQTSANMETAVPGSEFTAAPATAPIPDQTVTNPLQPPSIPLTQDPMSNAFPPLGGNAQTPPPLEPRSPATSEVPASNLTTDQPAATDPAIPPSEGGETSPSQGQQGTLDLSALKSGSPTAENQESQPGNPLPDIGPQENAPTDLSHLIAGDETQHQPRDVYTPPVAQDQNPGVSPVQTPTTTDGTIPPPGKHLNLTKVLLVAGIPIILIVAALSAYLILGIGKPASPDATNQTSLPIEQTKQQAPLTNPPQQIIAPSPISLPQQQVLPESSASTAVLPGVTSSPTASLSPAMQAAQRKASPSPSGQ